MNDSDASTQSDAAVGCIHRVGDGFIGVVCLIWAFSMAWGLSFLASFGVSDVWQAIGLTVAVTLYGIVIELLILLGLQKIFGPLPFIADAMRRSKLILWVAIAGIALALAIVVVFII